MAPALKPDILDKATDAAAIQKLMKADLKSRGGKKGVKFIAAKNCQIGSKTISLFIVTDTPLLFEQVIKKKFPKAYRAKGVCDVVNGPQGTYQVMIRSSAGQITPNTVADLVRPAVGSEKSIMASFEPSQTPTGLKPVITPNTAGVPQWAKDDYELESVETLIASMTPDGKIGSLYFDDDGRIRTTHVHGPQRSEHEDQTTVQFNIKQSEAQAAFNEAHKTAQPPLSQRTREERNELWKTWLKAELGQATPGNVPNWAKMVTGPATAYDVSQSGTPHDMQLIEIFKGINGRVEGWHPSRGVAARFVTDKQTIAVLHAAIKHIDGKYAQVNALESTDPDLVKRRGEIEEEYHNLRFKPGQPALAELWSDSAIAARMQALHLTKPSIDELDNDGAIRKRIDQLYEKKYREALKADDAMKRRMKVLGDLRNRAFYDFVKSRLPKSEIVKAMREPGKV